MENFECFIKDRSHVTEGNPAGRRRFIFIYFFASQNDQYFYNFTIIR